MNPTARSTPRQRRPNWGVESHLCSPRWIGAADSLRERKTNTEGLGDLPSASSPRPLQRRPAAVHKRVRSTSRYQRPCRGGGVASSDPEADRLDRHSITRLHRWLPDAAHMRDNCENTEARSPTTPRMDEY
ncbi:hypothetical protein NDU88_001583 [Pleurodeles waltl]|uniref:Uncharacterized protein n=1 Tax=Pleurodeles waltl TaxID=8319 RepID=A0AAV7WPS3_PLEWA|nr:hypothetical protein NDU88_001583 [Pleurodeles waltl]